MLRRSLVRSQVEYLNDLLEAPDPGARGVRGVTEPLTLTLSAELAEPASPWQPCMPPKPAIAVRAPVHCRPVHHALCSVLCEPGIRRGRPVLRHCIRHPRWNLYLCVVCALCQWDAHIAKGSPILHPFSTRRSSHRSCSCAGVAVAAGSGVLVPALTGSSAVSWCLCGVRYALLLMRRGSARRLET